MNNPLKFTDPSGEINWPAIWLGNWVVGGLDNWINKGMSFKQSFSLNNNPFVAGVNYHPGNNTWSNTQASAQNVATQDISIQISGFSAMDQELSGYGDFVINQQFVGESPLAGGVASSGGNTFGNMISGVGLGGYVASNIEGTFRITSGVNGAFSPKYYGSGWKGGSPARIATYSVSKVGIGVSTGASALSTGLAYYDIFSGGVQSITYADATVGTVGLTASVASYFSGAQIPGVGYFVAIYGATRLGYDIGWNLGVQYGPSTWFKPRQPESRVLEYMRQNGLFND